MAGGAASGSLVRLDGATGAVAGTINGGAAIAGLSTGRHLVYATATGPARLLGMNESGRQTVSVDLPAACPERAVDEARAYLADPTGRVLSIAPFRQRIAVALTVPFELVGAPLSVGDRLVLLARDGRVWAIQKPAD